jgi:hypothetical protein
VRTERLLYRSVLPYLIILVGSREPENDPVENDKFTSVTAEQHVKVCLHNAKSEGGNVLIYTVNDLYPILFADRFQA